MVSNATNLHSWRTEEDCETIEVTSQEYTVTQTAQAEAACSYIMQDESFKLCHTAVVPSSYYEVSNELIGLIRS